MRKPYLLRPEPAGNYRKGEHFLRVLQETGWKIEGSFGDASIPKRHPGTLRFRIKKLGIRRPV
jgi:hypothetical protein